MQLNLINMLVVSLALDRKCSDTIDEIYYKNEDFYYKAYLESDFSNSKIKKIFTMKTEDRINKLLGIVQASMEKDNILVIERIVKKVHPSIVNYVKKSNVVDLNDFAEKYSIFYLSEEENFTIGVALLFLAIYYDKKVIGDSYLYFIHEKWGYYMTSSNAKNFYEEDLKTTSNINILKNIESGYKLFNKDRSEKIDTSLEIFIQECIDILTCKKLNLDSHTDFKKLKEIPINVYQDARSSIFKKGVVGYIGAFSRYINSLGLESNDIFIDTKINNDILEKIFVDYTYSNKYNGVSESEKELYIISCIYIYNLIELYKECKDMYLNNLLEEKYKEALKVEEEIKNKKNKYETKISNYKTKLNEMKKENEILKKKLNELEKENKKLVADTTKQNVSIIDFENKVKRCNEIIEELKIQCNELSSAKQIDDNITLEDKIKYINQYKIGIFGGMNNIKNLSDTLTNVYFYNSKNQDISSIASLDAIFISYEFINHAFTNKINSTISKLNIPKRYISGTNLNLIIDCIYYELLKINDSNVE